MDKEGIIQNVKVYLKQLFCQHRWNWLNYKEPNIAFICTKCAKIRGVKYIYSREGDSE